MWQNLLEKAAEAADHKLALAPPDPRSYPRAANIHAQLRRREKTAEVLRAGLSRFPEAEGLQRCLMEVENRN